jgi:hypothetical protein
MRTYREIGRGKSRKSVLTQATDLVSYAPYLSAIRVGPGERVLTYLALNRRQAILSSLPPSVSSFTRLPGPIPFPINTHTQAQPNRRRHWPGLNSVTRLTPGLPSPSSHCQRPR